MDKPIDRGYVYFAMAFALGVELMNLRARRHLPAAAAHEALTTENKPSADS
jgi:hypothetical protein